MIPFIIAGAVGFGIAKLLEKDNTKKYAGGGKTGEIKDGDSVIMYFNQDTELEIFESEDLDEESYIDVFKKGEKFEVDIFGVDDTIYDVQFGDGDVAFIPKNNVTIVSVNDKTFAGGGRIDKMDKFISELAKKNTKEFSVNEYHDFRNKKYAIGVARHYFTDNDGSFSKFDTKLGDALNIDFETQGDSNKFAGGGKTGEIKDGDSVIMYFNQDTELEIFESEDLDEESYIDVFKKGEKFEVDIFGVDDTIYDVQFGDGDVAFIPKNNVTIVSVNDKTFASGGEAGDVEKRYGVYNYDTKNVEGYFDDLIEAEEFASQFKNASVYEKEYLVEAIITETDYDGEYVREIPISVNIFAKDKNSAMDKADDNIREQNPQWEDFEIDIVSVEILKPFFSSKGYMVFNYTDNLYATDEVFKTRKLANDFIKKFISRFAKQGYYRDNQMNKIDVEDISLMIIPSDFNPLKLL